MKFRRVVVTGLGTLSPLANSTEETWQKVLAGESGINLIENFDTTEFKCKFAGQVKNFNPEDYGISSKDARKNDEFILYGLAAAKQAIADSGLVIDSSNSHRIGVCVSSGIGGLTSIEKCSLALEHGGTRKVSPFFIPGTIINSASGMISIAHGLRGPNLAIVTACTTGTHSIGNSARLIAYGDADVMLAGGCEKASSPLGIAGFLACRALSTRNDNPQAASRPWDKDRDGFVLGDGSSILVLEEYEHAKKRGAKIYAELVGYGVSADAYHITLPGGGGAELAMKNAMNDAEINPSQVQYINAHATSTSGGDGEEINAIKAAFGNSAKDLAVSSTKSITGHLLGAAGAIEAVFSILALRDQIAPPTINLDNPSDDCDLDLIPHKAREMKLDMVLSNSFGFGGTNGSLIFKKI